MPLLTGKLTSALRARAVRQAALEGDLLREYFDDPATGDTIIRTTQEVAPIIANNKRLYNEGDGYSPSRDLRRAASVPCVMVEEILRTTGINALSSDPAHQQAMLRLLDDPAWSKLRTAPGRLSRRPVRCFFRSSTPSGPRIVRPSQRLRLVTK
jgi:hypothetical protein